MATVTVTGISSTTTFTATYSNVSDTCSVTVPGPAYSLAFSQDTYTMPSIPPFVDISCTLKDGDTPLSGETVYLSYEDEFGPAEVGVNTDSNGVATKRFAQMSLASLPATVTAEYQGVTATCTIVEG